MAEAAMPDLFRLTDEQGVVLEFLMPKNRPGARRVDDRSVISRIIHVLKMGGRWRDCPDASRPSHHDSQPLQQVVSTRFRARDAYCAGRGRLGRRDGGLGQQLRQGAPLGSRRERGGRAQAIGPSRGGQTTKVNVLADVLGRPAVIHLTSANASDVKTAPE